MSAVFLTAAILLEIVATLSLRASDGFSKPVPTLAAVAGYVLAFALLAQALKTIEVGVAYAVWSGVGTAAITIIGILALGESAAALKLLGTAMIVVGVVVLNLSDATG
jgi:small multidrug resistance pump